MPCAEPNFSEEDKEKGRKRGKALSLYKYICCHTKHMLPIYLYNANSFLFTGNYDGLILDLCSLIKSLSSEEFDLVVNKTRDRCGYDLETWWRIHQKWDSVRERIESEDKDLSPIEIRKKEFIEEHYGGRLPIHDEWTINLPPGWIKGKK